MRLTYTRHCFIAADKLYTASTNVAVKLNKRKSLQRSTLSFVNKASQSGRRDFTTWRTLSVRQVERWWSVSGKRTTVT